MKKLWAPWRSAYITGKKSGRCIFCGRRRPRPGKPGEGVLARSAHAFAMLNRFPYNSGHVMVAPYRHVARLEDLNDEELLDLMKLVTAMTRRISARMKPQGFNIGINAGAAAGAGFAGHIHVHIVPRWTGDTNFMPVLADTKVVSEALAATEKTLAGRGSGKGSA